jgi:hypothetical protein
VRAERSAGLNYAKAQPRLFAGFVAEKLSPVKLPKRIVRGELGADAG